MSFYKLHTNYSDFFDYYEKKHNKREQYDNVYYIALDAEWHRAGQRNNILSYQIATASNSKSENIIKYTKTG